MFKRMIIYLFISLFMSFIYYFSSENILLSIVVLFLFLFYFIILFDKGLRNYLLVIKKTRECIGFINNFIINLSINKSITTTFNNLKSSFNGELIETINSVSHLGEEDIVNYLKDYFSSSLYNIFLKLLNQFIYTGGNILNSANLLIYDSRTVEESLNNFLSIGKRKIIEFIVMWGMNFIILLILKPFLGTYYQKMTNMSLFPYGILLVFIVFLITMFLFFNHMFNLKFINSEIKYEKNKKAN
ncbi:MAG: hypothetical protein WCR97_04015 [Bacilli bacterium]